MPGRRCLYEELSIAQSADDAEIKRAYRVAALRWHPDKNRGTDEAEASERFKAVQHAYEVLSDSHERTWYDSHRDSFIAGRSTHEGTDEEPSAQQATNLDLFSYFSVSAYDGFEDTSQSFYGVYGMVFSTLAAEERSAGSNFSTPTFGTKDSEWDEVRRFYATCEGFSSRKSFGFADKWNLAEAPNRDYRRAMERENKRERAKVKKEFNALVRELASFVKKRDPRVRARKAAEAEDKDEREKAAKARKAQDFVEKKARAADYRAQRDAVLDEDAEELDRILEQLQLDEDLETARGRKHRGRERFDGCNTDSSNGSDDESCVNHCNQHTCIREESTSACTKHANEEQLHNNSDESDESDAECVSQDPSGHEDEEEPGESEDDLYCAACKKLFRTAGQKQNHEQSKKHVLAAKKLRLKLMKEDALFAGTPGLLSQPLTSDATVEAQGSQTSSMSKKKDKRAAKKRIQAQRAMSIQLGAESSNDDREGASLAADQQCEAQPEEDQTTLSENVAHTDVCDGHSRIESDVTDARPRRGQKRRQKKSSSAAANDDDGAALVCHVCSARFASRNKLFAHVKEKGHAVHK